LLAELLVSAGKQIGYRHVHRDSQIKLLVLIDFAEIVEPVRDGPLAFACPVLLRWRRFHCSSLIAARTTSNDAGVKLRAIFSMTRTAIEASRFVHVR
jgi:hypothetical protein